MDVDKYRHNYEGFYKKITHQMSINRERMTTTQGAHASLVRIISLFSFSLYESFEEEIQLSRDGTDIARG